MLTGETEQQQPPLVEIYVELQSNGSIVCTHEPVFGEGFYPCGSRVTKMGERKKGTGETFTFALSF